MKTKWCFGVCLSFLIILATSLSAQSYTSILSFGDSLSDNGRTGRNGIPGDRYGFFRFSNGSVWVEYLAHASHFNAPLYDMAIGGATSGFDNPAASAIFGRFIPAIGTWFSSNTGLRWQVANYQARSGGIPAGTLITLWSGGNDMLNWYQGEAGTSYTPISEANYQAGLYNPENAAANVGIAIQDLIDMGGRDFIVPNLPFTGMDPYLGWIRAFDASLTLELANLRSANAGVAGLHIYGVDLSGLVVTGIDYMTGTWLEKTYGDGTYYFWDEHHPTTEVHAQIANYVASSVPVPSAVVLLLSGLVGLIGIRRKSASRMHF